LQKSLHVTICICKIWGPSSDCYLWLLRVSW